MFQNILIIILSIIFWSEYINSVMFSSIAQSCLTLCDPMDCITTGFPVHHQLPERGQTHVYWVSDVIQPSHPLFFPSPPAFNPSKQQSLFQWVSSLHQVPKYWSFSFSISPSNEYSAYHYSKVLSNLYLLCLGNIIYLNQSQLLIIANVYILITYYSL